MDIDVEAGHQGNNPGDVGLHDEGGHFAMEVDQPGVEAVRAETPQINDEHASDVPNNPIPDPPQLTRRRQHGYATVEVHKTAARVIRWEYVDPDDHPSPADVLKQQEWFKLGEWLASLPISDNQRAAYE